jgi:hypothetical protein
MNAENFMILAIGCVFCLVGLGVFWAVVQAISGAVGGVNNRQTNSRQTTSASSSSDDSGSSYSSNNDDNSGADDDKDSGGGLGSFIWENIRPPDDLLDGSFLFPSSRKDDDDDE